MDPELLAYLREDVGATGARGSEDALVDVLLAGDITTRALAGAQRVRAVVVAKRSCVVSGMAEASAVFAHLGAKVEHLARDGERLPGPREVMRVQGPAAAVLTGERLALNLLMRMSGIATLTRTLQDKVAAVNPACRVAATRKTTPGFRRFEKRAVEIGGGDPHRFGLHDAFLVKDNHLLLVDDPREAVRRCRALDPGKLLQVEADTVEQAIAAAEAGADAVLLDNFAPADARAAYRLLKGRFPRLMVEVSGGITPANVADYALAADRISLGYLTHSAVAVDFGMDVVRVD